MTDTYPLFSHSDQALITLGDAFASEARIAQGLNIPPASKEQLVKVYNDQAAAAYDRVVTKYATAPHVEDAKDRLIALGRPVPEPSHDELAESQAEEESHVPVKLSQRAVMLFSARAIDSPGCSRRRADHGRPCASYAPQVTKATLSAFNAAIAGKPAAAPVQAASGEIQAGTAPPRSDQPAPAPQLENVPESGGGNGVGAEIITPGANGAGAAPVPAENPTPGAAAPAGSVTPAPTTVPDNGGLKPVGPTDTSQLPAVDKPAEAPAQVNDVKAAPAQVTTGTTSGKTASKKGNRGKYDSDNESSSKHKKKKGVDKLNPF